MCTTGVSMSAILLVVFVMVSTVAGYKNDDLVSAAHKIFPEMQGLRLKRGLFDNLWNHDSEDFMEPNEIETFANPDVLIESMESKPSTPMPEAIIPESPCSQPEKLELRCLRVQRRIFHDEELALIRRNQEQEWGTMKRQHLQRIFDFELRAAKAKAEQAELELQIVKNRYISH